MIQSGRVVEKNGGELKVCFHRPEMCEKCGACIGRAHEELVAVKGDAELGDTVDVEMPDARILKASVLAYALPLLGLLIGIVIGQTATGSDVWAAVGGVIGLAVCFGGLHLTDKKLAVKNNWRPKVVAVRQANKGE